MKKTSISILALFLAVFAWAQKKPLDHSVYDSWQNISSVNLSDDGNFVAYRVAPQQGDAELVIARTSDWSELRIPRGGVPLISCDSRWLICQTKAPYAATRQARIKKKKEKDMPKDSLVFVDLQTFETTRIPDGSSARIPHSGDFFFIYEFGGKDDLSLVVYRPGGSPDTLKHVDKYAFEREGRKLAVVFKKSKKDSLSSDKAVLYKLPSMEQTLLSEGMKWYGRPNFNVGADKLALLASADSNKTGSRDCSIVLYEELTSGRGRKAVTTTNLQTFKPEGAPEGWCIGTNSPLKFSRSSNRLFVGISEIVPQDDTTLVDFETAKLDIWNSDIYMTPPMQKAQAGRIKEANCLCAINLADRGRLVPLSSSLTEQVFLIDGGESDTAIAIDNIPYRIRSTWDENNLHDVWKVNLNDGSRVNLFTGLDGWPHLSPAGKYLCWYSDRNWYTYRLADGRLTNLTEGVDGQFWDDEDDHPAPSPAFDRAMWQEGDEAVFLTDKYDIFRMSPDGGKVVNLTAGAGRATDRRYRLTFLSRSDIHPALSEVGVERTIGKKELLYLTVFDRTTKENGFATVGSDAPGLKSSFTAPASYANPTKAFAADMIAYRKGDFKHSMDVYVSPGLWKSEKKISSINPQQEEYLWGDARLVHWKAYDGTPLDGILITPENLDPTKKYPMISYFYEKNSQTLYSYSSPAPSRSVINFPFYASRGYVVFIPDIVYKDGHPGESAYNCICSGVESMCSQFSFIDPDRLGIQGQSWGGYQTAYLVTRTHMFAAAGAGAPVGNMTSAYGGIRWGSGVVRAMQYEHGQSRIGASLWDEGGLDLYIENSPVFHTKDVTTPVLIMHNDSDGAVPWYQGIEFFMALRRFEHPAWLLQYNGEEHNLSQRKNSKDLSVRLQQFFDHYLKGEPMPAWMKTGVPYSRKGQYFGFELTEP